MRPGPTPPQPAAGRLVTLTLLVAVVVVGGWLAVRLLHGGGDPDPAATVSATQPAPTTPSTVVLVPGYGGSASSLTDLAAVLRAAGHPVAVVALPGDGTGDIRQLAGVLDTVVAGVRATASAVDVVGYSMGGLVARVWAADLGGAGVARRVVTVGTPNHGTDTAALAAFAGACPPACRQMQPDSDLLAALADGDPTPDGPAWITVWSADDQTIRPPASTELDGASNVQLQATCPGVVVDHGGLVRDPEPLAVLLRAVATEAWSTPTTCLGG